MAKDSAHSAFQHFYVKNTVITVIFVIGLFSNNYGTISWHLILSVMTGGQLETKLATEACICISISCYFNKIDKIAFPELEKKFSNDFALFP